MAKSRHRVLGFGSLEDLFLELLLLLVVHALDVVLHLLPVHEGLGGEQIRGLILASSFLYLFFFIELGLSNFIIIDLLSLVEYVVVLRLS